MSGSNARCAARAGGSWLALLIGCVMAWAPQAAKATGCELQFIQNSPISVAPGSSTVINLAVVDAIPGACSNAAFVVATVSDTSEGTLLNPTSGNINFGASPESLTIQAPTMGGGSAVFQALCEAGCESVSNPNPFFTVNIGGDTYAIDYVSPTSGFDFIGGGASIDLSVLLSRNGMPGDLGPTERDVCFEFVPGANPLGASLTGGFAACGNGGRLVEADPMGFAGITLVGAPNMCGETLVRATAVGFPVPGSRQFTLFGNDPTVLSAVTGDGQQAVQQTPFPMPLRARLQCGTGSPTPIAAAPIFFQRVSGESAALAGGLSEVVVATDAAGEASVPVFATAIPGNTVFRACPDGPVDCDTSAEFNLLTLGASMLTLEPSGETPFEAAPGASVALAVQARNDAAPAVSVGINWTPVSGGAAWSTPSGSTDATGVAQNIAVLPASPGLSVLRAERADSPGIATDFDIETVVYSFVANSPPTGEPGVPVVFGAGVQRLGQIAELVPEGVVAWNLQSGPGSASLIALDDGLIIANRSRFELLAFEPGTYVVRGQYLPPSGMPPVFTDIAIEVLGSSGEFEVRFAPPEFQLYSDETSSAGLLLTVLGPGQGAPQPLPGFFVDVSIASGNAVFAGAGSTLLVSSDENGQIRTPPIEVGSSIGDVRIVAGYKGLVLGELTLPVAASTYSIQFIPPTGAVTPGASLSVGVAMSRTGSGAAQAFAGAPVQWTAQGGRLQSAVTITELDGRSFNRFTVDAKSSVVLQAAFAPGGGLLGASVRVELGAENPGIQIVSGDGQAALPGSMLPNPVVVEATLGGLAQAGVPIQLRSDPQGAAEIEPPNAITDDSGRARFQVRLLENAQPGLSLVASRADAPEASAPVRVEVGAGPALRELVALSGGGQFTPPGAEFAEPLVVEARNDGQPAGDVAVRFEVSPRGAATVVASSQRTSAAGRIEARVQLGAAAAGPIEVIAVRSDEPLANARFTLFPTTGGGEQRLEIESGNQQTGIVGARAQPLVVRYLVNGQGAPGARIDWQVLSGNAALDQPFAVTDADGRASQGLRFGPEAGDVRVRASIANLDVVFVLSSRPAQLEISGGNQQRAASGQALPEPLRVRVLPDPVAGLSVEWRVLTGNGQLQAASSQTDASGEASMRWTLGPQAGRQTAAARLPGGAEVVFEAQAEGLADGEIRIVSGNNQQLVTGLASEPMVVELLSASGQPLAGVPLLWSAQRGLLIGDESSSTAQDGRSSIRIQLDLPGEVRVSVRVPDTDLAQEFVINGAIAASPGAGGRRRTVAEALDASCDAVSRLETRTAQQQDLLERCRELADAASSDVPGIGRALDQLPNDVGLSLARAGDESMRGQVQNVDQRLRTLRGERSGAGSNRLQIGLGVSTPGGVLPVAALPGMAMAVDADALEREIGESFERWGAFVTGSIGRGRSRGNGETPRFDYSLGSLTAGVDYRLSDRLVLGAAVGYSRDETEFSGGRGTLDSSGTSISAFASFWLPQSWYVDANLSAGRNRFDLERSLVYSLVDRSGTTRTIDQRAWADTDARLLGGSLTAGRDWQRRSLNVGTYLRAQFSRIDYDAFEERMLEDRPGSGLALRVESPTWNSMEGVLGMRASWALSRDWGVLMPNLLLEYSHEFRDDPSRLDLRFVADPTGTVFTQSGAQTDTSHVNFGLGTSILLPGGRSGFIQYERRLFDDRISHWLLSVGGRFEF